MASFDDYFSPHSIAIVGASNDPQRIGGRPLAHMIKQRFEGAVYPVNPTRDTVQGLRSYRSLNDIEGELDFVLVAVPARDVAAVVRQAATKKAKTALIFSSGFAEAGGGGIALQAELTAIASQSGLRLIGPNCLGLFNAEARFYPTFSSTIDRILPVAGGVAVASQSGAYGSHIYIVSQLRGLSVRYWVTTGNEADLGVGDFIRMLAERDDVHTIMAYVEAVKDGAGFIEALETARANRKPVIITKVGRSAVGAEAASSHTAALAGEDEIYDAVFRQHGAYRARSTEEMLDIAYACRPRIYPAGKKLGVVSISGGAGVLIADAAADHGLDVAPMPKQAQDDIKSLLPFASARNPIDVTAQFFNDLSLIPRFTRMMLDQGGYDGIIGFWTSVAGSPILGGPLLSYLRDTMADYPGRLFLHCMVASDEMRRAYEDLGFPCFEDPSRAIAAMAALMFFGSEFERGKQARPDIGQRTSFPVSIPESVAKAILLDAGLPILRDTVARTRDDVAAAIAEIAGPVAMKISSPDVAHKTEIGGVILGVEGIDAAFAAFDKLRVNLQIHDPKARFDGVLISRMATGGVECILGAKIDPVFGPVVMFGLGGIFAETLKDVSFRCAPVTKDAARAMIQDLKGAAVLNGARGRAPADVEALADAISKLSCFAAANAVSLESVEINPLLALPSGAIALDALIVTKTAREAKNERYQT